MRPPRRAPAASVCAAALWLVIGCDLSGGAAGAPSAGTAGETGQEAAGEAGPAGASCRSSDDCPSGQACVASACRYRQTSRAGDVLAMGARGQLEAGDTAGAVRTYEQALEAYGVSDAPAPPEVLCGAASAALRAALDQAAREQAASLADRCFRGSLPGNAARLEVERGIARLRFDGLNLAAFDAEEPPDRYFTAEPSRPTADAIEIALDLLVRDRPGYEELGEALRSEAAQRAISDCFIQDWEISHARSAEASLVLKFSTRMRDMGDYDAYEPEVSVAQTSLAEDGFEPCVATALGEALQPGPRLGGRVSEWQEPFAVAARVQ